MRRALTALLLAVALLAPAAAVASPVRVRTFAGNAAREAELSERAASALALTAQALGIALESLPAGFEVEVVMAPSDAIFARELRAQGASAPDWALAVALPQRRWVAVREHATAPLTDNDPLRALRHELAHILIGEVERERGAPIPRWLHEGLAMWGSGQRLGRIEELELARAVQDEVAPTFAALEQDFPPHAQEAQRAYLLSLGFVEYVGRRGEPPGAGVAALVKELREVRLEVALFRVLGEEDAEWWYREDLVKRSSSLELLLRQLGLWQLAGLLAILAIGRHLVLRRRLRARLIAEERAEDRAQRAAEEEALRAEEAGGAPEASEQLLDR